MVDFEDEEIDEALEAKKRSINRKKKQAKKDKKRIQKYEEVFTRIKHSISARKIQKVWRSFRSQALFENQSLVEESSIEIDYTFQLEKLFDFTQIESNPESKKKNPN